MRRQSFQHGDWVVFRRVKHTTRPGRRARDVQAAEHGDYYTYSIDKFWIVEEVLPDGTMTLRTRRGKTHTVRMDDPNVRHATLWERIRYRSRFAQLQPAEPTG